MVGYRYSKIWRFNETNSTHNLLLVFCSFLLYFV